MLTSRPLLAMALVLAGACSRAPAHGAEPGSAKGSADAPAATTPAPAPTVPVATVTLAGARGAEVVTVEVVRSPALLEKGLMYRKFMPADHGMLFLMGDVDDHHFWMQNTLIPLDIMFITADHKVAGILENMQPHDTRSRGVGAPSRYVLEVNGGWSKAHGVSAGTSVTFDGVDAARR